MPENHTLAPAHNGGPASSIVRPTTPSRATTPLESHRNTPDSEKKPLPIRRSSRLKKASFTFHSDQSRGAKLNLGRLSQGSTSTVNQASLQHIGQSNVSGHLETTPQQTRDKKRKTAPEAEAFRPPFGRVDLSQRVDFADWEMKRRIKVEEDIVIARAEIVDLKATIRVQKARIEQLESQAKMMAVG